jgi:hypothetical protein
VLTGPYAYKIKKSVRFDFLDASTLDRRRQLCEEEVRPVSHQDGMGLCRTTSPRAFHHAWAVGLGEILAE